MGPHAGCSAGQATLCHLRYFFLPFWPCGVLLPWWLAFSPHNTLFVPGVNLDTEMFYFYRRDRKGELVFDRDVKDAADFQGYTMREVRGSFLHVWVVCQCVLRAGDRVRDERHGAGHPEELDRIARPPLRRRYSAVRFAQLLHRVAPGPRIAGRRARRRGTSRDSQYGTSTARTRTTQCHDTRHTTLTTHYCSWLPTDNRLFFRLLIEHVSEPLTLRQRRERETVVLGCIDDELDDTNVDA